jgi:hypothetical protein
MAGISYQVLRDKWWVVTPCDHLFYFTSQTITRLLNIAGFQVLKLWSKGVDGHGLCDAFIRQPAASRQVHKSSMPVGAAAASAVLPIHKLQKAAWMRFKQGTERIIARVVCHMGKGDWLFVYAAKA